MKLGFKILAEASVAAMGRHLETTTIRKPLFCQALVLVILACASAIASDSGTYVSEPNVVGRIVSALTTSMLDHLTPRISQDGSRKFSYHLASVRYLGTIERGSERFILATALFMRSSAKDSEYPPARGHGYILCLTPDFHLLSHCRLDFPDTVEFTGTTLRREGKTIADFATHDVATKQKGFLVDGDDFLPYPFADRLPAPNSPP